jgi:hypothetical protein
VDEVQRRDHRDPRIDADLFDAQQQQRRPEQVRELSGEEQHAEGHGRREALGAEPEPEVTDEHDSALSFP